MLRPLTGEQPVELIFDTVHTAQEPYTDESKLTQIMRNLMSNALKFTEQGEVRGRCAPDARSKHIFLSGSDTGIGIAESHLQLIFEEFSQIENPLQKRSKGTGLGLPLCRKLARLLGGSIGVAREPGKGSTFKVSIPLAYAITQGKDVADNAPHTAAPGSPENALPAPLCTTADDHIHRMP